MTAGRVGRQHEATFTEIVPTGLVPESIRFDFHDSGSAVDGLLTAAVVCGVGYLLLRADGVGVLDVRLVLTTPRTEGRFSPRNRLLGTTGRRPGAPLEMLPSPGFAWTDRSMPIHGFALCQTGAAELAWLNHTAVAFEGWANAGAKKLTVTARTLIPIPQPPIA